jgi:hypothetical protein
MKVRTRIGLVAVVVLALLTAGTWIFNSSSHSALERYKAELRAKGEKLRMTELAVAPSTNADEVACRDVFATNQVRPPGLMPSLMSYTGPGKARVAWKGGLQLEVGKGTWAELEQQVANAEPVMEIFRRALEHPAPDSGWVYRDEFPIPWVGPKVNFVPKRAVAQNLMCAAICSLHRADLDGAFANLHALANLSRIEKNDLPLVWGMIRVAIAGLGLSTTWEALQAPGWDEARLAQLQRDWEQFDALDALERGVEGERASGQTIMAWVRKASAKEFESTMVRRLASPNGNTNQSLLDALRSLGGQIAHTAYKIGGMNADEMAQLQYYAEALEGIRRLRANHGFAEVGNAASNAVVALDRKMTQDRWHRLKLAAMIVPNLSRAMETASHVETQRRLTIAAIAIKRYELKHGAVPAELSALTPEFLSAVPLDPMNGKPMGYRLKADRTFVLYSAGEDGKDDGGDATPTIAKFELWSGKDAVWPTAVTNEESAELVKTQARPEK